MMYLVMNVDAEQSILHCVDGGRVFHLQGNLGFWVCPEEFNKNNGL